MGTELQGPEGTETPEFTFDSEGVGEGFLKDIPEVDRNVVSPHVSKWSQSVDKKFREIHDQYKPYKEFGSPDDIKKWKQVVDLIESNPQQVYESLKAHLGIEDAPKTPEGEVTPPVGGSGNGGEQVQGLPPEVQKKLDDLEKLTRGLTEHQLSQTKAQQEAEQQQAFDSMMSSLEEKHGKFDLGSVIYRIAQGEEPEAAVLSWKKEFGLPTGKPVVLPPANPATGSVPQGTDIRKMGKKETQDLVVSMLQNLGK